jgi:hypothetical protein
MGHHQAYRRISSRPAAVIPSLPARLDGRVADARWIEAPGSTMSTAGEQPMAEVRAAREVALGPERAPSIRCRALSPRRHD